MNSRILRSTSPILFLLLTCGRAGAEATPAEMGDAVKRFVAGNFIGELFAACEYSTDSAVIEDAKRNAIAYALTKDSLAHKLTDDQLTAVALKANDTDVVASLRKTAQADAAAGECKKRKAKDLWNQFGPGQK